MTTAFTVSTRRKHEVIPIAREVQAKVAETDIQDGLCVVHVPHTTAGVTLQEAEEGLMEDLPRVLEHLIPKGDHYTHDRTSDTNTEAHIKRTLCGGSVSIPIVDGKLSLGTWEQILLLEFDGPRQRRVQVCLIATAP